MPSLHSEAIGKRRAAAHYLDRNTYQTHSERIVGETAHSLVYTTPSLFLKSYFWEKPSCLLLATEKFADFPVCLRLSRCFWETTSPQSERALRMPSVALSALYGKRNATGQDKTGQEGKETKQNKTSWVSQRWPVDKRVEVDPHPVAIVMPLLFFC